MSASKHILPIIVIAQFCCTSLWFAGNAVISDLIEVFQLGDSALGHLTSAVQFGFIFGTLLFALLTISDRFSPSKVFFVCALSGALINLGIIANTNHFTSLLVIRFATGFFLAGIYPIGMKIAADYFDQGLGKSLGYLVGALVLGTAFPHLLKGFESNFTWQVVIVVLSTIAAIGGVMVLLFIPNGPYRKKSQKFDLFSFFKVFRSPQFRKAAFGYFGHMWELYAFWTFVPIMLSTYALMHHNVQFNIPFLSFGIIGIGSLSCIAGGYLSQYWGAEKTAFTALLLSGICCLLSPFIFAISSSIIFIGFLFLWGIVVIADSPMFSTLVAKNADPEIRGTALTIVNCIGFAITIVSIQLLSGLIEQFTPSYLYLILSFGPIFGLVQWRYNR